VDESPADEPLPGFRSYRRHFAIAADFGGFADLLTVRGQLSITVIAHRRAVSDLGVVVHLVIRHMLKAQITHRRLQSHLSEFSQVLDKFLHRVHGRKIAETAQKKSRAMNPAFRVCGGIGIRRRG